MFKRPHLLIATTVPQTFATILSGQPRFLSQHFEINLVTSPGKELDLLKNEGVGVYSVPMRRGISFFCDLLSIFLMVRLLRQVRPQIVHSYTPKAGLVCMLAAWICGVPIRVHTFTGLIWPISNGWRRYSIMMADRILCICATNIIPESFGVLKDLRTGLITRKHLQMIGHGNIAGVDVNFFSPKAAGLAAATNAIKKYYEIIDSDFVFVFVGRLHQDKGLKELLSAFTQLPLNCKLLVVGDIDSNVPIDVQSINLLRTHPRIHWLGFQQDVRAALNASNVLVLPSYREGFSNVLLQAAAMERPAIATNISGSNELITEGYNGWLIPVKNTKALADAMLIARNTSSLNILSMGRAARNMVEERYERSAHLERLISFYKSLLDSTQR